MKELLKKKKFYILTIALLIISIFFLVIASYLGFLFIAHDFDPDFLKIDYCLDGGGEWDYDERECNYK